MRVVHINEHLSWSGGVETYLLNLLPRLAEEGIEPHLVYAKGDASLLHSVATTASPEVAQFTPQAEQTGYAKTRQLLAEVAPDVVHIHRVFNLGVIRACLESVPTVLTSHDYTYLCPAGSFFHRRSKTICSKAAGLGCFLTTAFRHCLTPRPRIALAYYRRVSSVRHWRDSFQAVICPSDSVRERFLQTGFAPAKVRTIPYFCPLEAAQRPRPRPAKPTVLFVGRMRPIKGFDVFVQAIGLLGDAVHGLMVGDAGTETQRRIRSLAAAAGCGARLELRPWAAREEIRSLYEAATVFAFPSICPETLGIVGLEAMACGVPVVASDVGGVRQWLEDGRNGYLVPPKDPHALADAIRRMLSGEQRLGAMELAAIDTVRQRFLPEHHIAALLDVYGGASRPVANLV